jgi:predicted solute-binding protein
MTKDRKTALHLHALISRRPGILDVQLGDDAVLASVESGRMSDLNATAAEIWRLLETPITFAALCDRLERDFAVARPQLEQDVTAFLDHLQAMEMIEVCAPDLRR